MSVMAFNPFLKSIDEIDVDDLSKLRSIAEGWYIEYKSQVVPNQNIAKSLSAFANHFGGWIFYGVEGEKGGGNVAVAFPGLSQSDTSKMIENIRNAAKDSISPPPYYESKVIQGPSDLLGLQSDKYIIIVRIPSGTHLPYITDGRIYRRIADSSDPKKETDRVVLDDLWRQREKRERFILDRLDEMPHISKGEEDDIFMHLFLLNGLDDSFNNNGFGFDKFVDVMSGSEDGYSIKFDNFFSDSDGFVARYIGNNDPYNMSMTWKYFYDGSSIVSFRLRHYDWNDFNEYRHNEDARLLEYEYGSSLLDIANLKNHKYIKFIDVNLVILVVLTFINKHLRLMSEKGDLRHFYAKAYLNNIWRTTPYIDIKEYLDFVDRHNFPILQREDQFAPPGKDLQDFVIINPDWDIKDPLIFQFSNSAVLLKYIVNALGLPDSVVFLSNDWINAIRRCRDIIQG
ncbi:ATP-binding protein [Chloroflexia bacterium SDU3-3]|nr:ATP-binding protein [Chloroflexia bacterium SDU3-3]